MDLLRARAVLSWIISAFDGSSLSLAKDIPLLLARFNDPRVNFFVIIGILTMCDYQFSCIVATDVCLPVDISFGIESVINNP